MLIRVNFIMVSNVKRIMKIMRFFCCQVYYTHSLTDQRSPIALYRKMQIFGVTLKSDPHFCIYLNISNHFGGIFNENGY